MMSESMYVRDKHKSKRKSKHKRKSRDKDKSKRAHFTYRNVAGSSRDHLCGRPPSLNRSYDPYFSYQYEPQPFYELESSYYKSSYHPSRTSSASKRPSWDYVAGGARTHLDRELPFTRGWDHCRGSSSISSTSMTRPSATMTVRKEGFSTIFEQPTEEAAEQDAYCWSSLQRLAVTTETLGSSGLVEKSSSAVVSSTWTERTALEHPGTTNKRPLPLASSVSSMLEKLIAEGSNASWGKELVFERDHNTLSTARESEQTTHWKDAFAKLRFVCGKLRPKLWADGDKFSFKNIVSKLHRFHNTGSKDDHITLEQDPEQILVDEESLTPETFHQGKETTGLKWSRVPTFYKQLVDLESMVNRDRKCALALAVGLVTAVFLLAIAFIASTSFSVGLPPDQRLWPDQPHENAVNAEHDVNVNAINASGKSKLSSKAHGPITVAMPRSTSSLPTQDKSSTSSLPTQDKSLFFSLKDCVNSTVAVTQAMQQSPLVIKDTSSTQPNVTNENATTSSTEVVSPAVNILALYEDKNDFSYGGGTTSAQDDVF